MTLFKIKITVILFMFLTFQLIAQMQLPIASDNIIFEVEFDNKDTTADISQGKPNVLKTLGKIVLKKSPWGNALYCGKGGAKLRYEIANNIVFWENGTAILWFRPLNWKEVRFTHPRVFFFGVESNKGFFGVQVGNGPKSLNILERKIRILLFYFKHIPSTIMNINGISIPKDNNWHMLAVTWGKNEIGLSLNGAPFAIKKINGVFKKEYFKGPSFSLGSNVGANYLLYMLRIYNCRLNDQELKDIYTKKSKLIKEIN